jgi:hypothetical protein
MKFVQRESTLYATVIHTCGTPSGTPSGAPWVYTEAACVAAPAKKKVAKFFWGDWADVRPITPNPVFSSIYSANQPGENQRSQVGR